MNRSERIISLLTQELAPTRLEVEDESGKHIGHVGARPGGETHYRVLVESAAFTGKSHVARHQMIYALLDDELKTGLHALSIQALAPGDLA